MARHSHVVVTGATGFIARNVRKHLSDMGMYLSSISRHDFCGIQDEKKIITTRYDPGIILPAIKECDSMIHLVGIGNTSVKDSFDSVNFLLTKKMIEMCKDAGVRKFVYLSGLGVSEDSPLEYFLSKYRAEQQIISSGLDFTIFRPSYIVGRDDALTASLKKQIRKGIIIMPGSGKFTMQPVYINDAAKVIVKSLTNSRFSNKIFDLVGPESTTYQKYIRQFSRHKSVKIQKIQLESAYHDAITSKAPAFGIDDLNLLAGNFSGNYSRLARYSGMQFQSVAGLFQSGILP